jgi:hypothetical protein
MAGTSAFSVTSNTDINVPAVGIYLVQWNRRTTFAYTGIAATYVTTNNNSGQYGWTPFSADCGAYISCSAVVPITSILATISCMAFSQFNDLVLDNTNSNENRLTIYLLSSMGTII